MSSQCQVINHLDVMTYLSDSKMHQIHDEIDFAVCHITKN